MVNSIFILFFGQQKKDIKSVESILNKNVKFNYPILLDTLGEFEKLNPHLPKNHLLHTVLVGNPLRNKKIEEMFYKIVEEKLGKPQQPTTKKNDVKAEIAN